jgi:hypothetical protein
MNSNAAADAYTPRCMPATSLDAETRKGLLVAQPEIRDQVGRIQLYDSIAFSANGDATLLPIDSHLWHGVMIALGSRSSVTL